MNYRNKEITQNSGQSYGVYRVFHDANGINLSFCHIF